MSQLTSNTKAFVHKEQYGKSTKKRKKVAMKHPMKKKPMKKKTPMKKPKKQGY